MTSLRSGARLVTDPLGGAAAHCPRWRVVGTVGPTNDRRGLERRLFPPRINEDEEHGAWLVAVNAPAMPGGALDHHVTRTDHRRPFVQEKLHFPGDDHAEIDSPSLMRRIGRSGFERGDAREQSAVGRFKPRMVSDERIRPAGIGRYSRQHPEVVAHEAARTPRDGILRDGAVLGDDRSPLGIDAGDDAAAGLDGRGLRPPSAEEQRADGA